MLLSLNRATAPSTTNTTGAGPTTPPLSIPRRPPPAGRRAPGRVGWRRRSRALSVREVTLEYRTALPTTAPAHRARPGPREPGAAARRDDRPDGRRIGQVLPAGRGRRPDQAHVRDRDGRGGVLTELPEKELARIRRGHTVLAFQQPNLLAALTSREQLALGARGGRPRQGKLRAARTRADEAAEQVGRRTAATAVPTSSRADSVSG
ncbi:hypothetical protein QJS66_06915 [Kocuria rhizophila]|nr:hypothetical protein QJS66_06915 [Kocuria rhizophila]